MLVARILAPDGARCGRGSVVAALAVLRDGSAVAARMAVLMGGERMNLTPREKDKLLISMAAMVARRRLERGVKLNHPGGGRADHRLRRRGRARRPHASPI